MNTDTQMYENIEKARDAGNLAFLSAIAFFMLFHLRSPAVPNIGSFAEKWFLPVEGNVKELAKAKQILNELTLIQIWAQMELINGVRLCS